MSDTVSLTLDLDALTIDEIDAVESITGEPIDALNAAGRKAKLFRAIAVVNMNRVDPDEYPLDTADHVAESMRKVGGLKISLDDPEVEPADPTPPAAPSESVEPPA